MTRPAYEAVAARLREQILGGELSPGDRLPTEPELSTRYGVSRSTVREALRVLSSQNLVETTRGVSGGSFVVHPRAEHVRDFLEVSLGLLAVGQEVSVDALLEVRDLLEVPAAGLAARNATTEQLEAMRATLLDPAASEVAAMNECNHQFHALLVAATGNRLLEVVASPVYQTLVSRFDRVGDAELPFWEAVVDDHRLILDALEAHDADRAQQLTRAHLERLRNSYLQVDEATRSGSVAYVRHEPPGQVDPSTG
jgi:GntR family transcriptional regulator, transcriptional repressor for pyruvate dehydrogenase complex